MRGVFLGGFLAVLLTACGKDKTDDTVVDTTVPQLKVEVLPFFGADSLWLDSTYVLDNGNTIQFTDIKFFFTNLHNGTNILKDYAMFDFRNKGYTLLQVNGSWSNFSSLNGSVGVDSVVNHNDPSAFLNSSALNITNAGDMHWDWNPGYIFIKLEARVDTLQDGTDSFDHYLTYHVGTDAYFSSKNFPAINWIQNTSYLRTARFQLDLKNVIDHPTNPVDVLTDYITHSSVAQSALTEKIRSNFISSLTAQ